ncbi:FecR family protein [Wenyingzhuangia sp. 2_MG-2023]|uniref:FecR family protein n=1 Tax=Wenyingzhuangia sp. 2_MG-2023 TaxID=3062639 RepID=UPI0026E22DA9|nr:FecR family protein [Wenyingzhuangia sp. 2_MG-2023]MDO6736839.1 FecR family protein [Wenyingzhuangia sp. 2_MG-2023]
MTKKEFLELIKKDELGECSAAEKRTLQGYCDKVQAKNKMSSWSLSDEEEQRIKLLQRINISIRKEELPKKKERTIFKWSVAASIAVLLFSSAIYFYQTNLHKIPKNAISLELHDGTIISIDEHESQNIFNEDRLIGHQSGKKLVYGTTSFMASEVRYNTLRVPYGKTFELTLSDGTNVHLNSGSSMKYATSFSNSKERNVFLTGEAFLKVTKNASKPFIVNGDAFSVRVFGTEFNVNSYPGENIAEVVLVEGSVGVYTDAIKTNPAKSIRLEPGYKASFDKNNRSLIKKKVSTKSYVSWVDDMLIIRNMTFEDILKKLERMYNVKIVNENLKLSKEVFNANFGKKPIAIEQVMQELNMAYGINYVIEKNLITIK